LHFEEGMQGATINGLDGLRTNSGGRDRDELRSHNGLLKDLESATLLLTAGVTDKRGGEKPALKDTGQPFGCPALSAIEEQQANKKHLLMALARLKGLGFSRPATDFAVTGVG